MKMLIYILTLSSFGYAQDQKCSYQEVMISSIEKDLSAHSSLQLGVFTEDWVGTRNLYATWIDEDNSKTASVYDWYWEDCKLTSIDQTKLLSLKNFEPKVCSVEINQVITLMKDSLSEDILIGETKRTLHTDNVFGPPLTTILIQVKNPESQNFEIGQFLFDDRCEILNNEGSYAALKDAQDILGELKNK